MHIDHGLDLNFCMKAVRAGFTSIMCDRSEYPLEGDKYCADPSVCGTGIAPRDYGRGRAGSHAQQYAL